MRNASSNEHRKFGSNYVGEHRRCGTSIFFFSMSDIIQQTNLRPRKKIQKTVSFGFSDESMAPDMDSSERRRRDMRTLERMVRTLFECPIFPEHAFHSLVLVVLCIELSKRRTLCIERWGDSSSLCRALNRVPFESSARFFQKIFPFSFVLVVLCMELSEEESQFYCLCCTLNF